MESIVIGDLPEPNMTGELAYDGSVSNGSAPAIDLSATATRLAAMAAIALVCVRTGLEPDFWGHLKFGLDLLSSGHLDAVDPYSFTHDRPWINHEWLSELLFAMAYRGGGVAGLILLKSLVLIAAAVCLYATLRHTRPELRHGIIALVFIGLAPIAVTFRPHLWTILGLAWLCVTLSGRVRLVWLVPAFAVWANMHGGWIVGLAFGGLWTLGRVVDTRRLRPHLPALATLAACLATTLLNPYGLRLWTFLLETVRPSRPDITEWRPYWESIQLSHIVFFPAAIGVLGATLALRWRAVSWARLLPAVWLGANALFVARLAPLFGLAALFVVAEAWARPEEAAAGTDRHSAFEPTRLVDAAVIAALVWPSLSGDIRCLTIPERWGPDLIAAGALSVEAAQGRLVVPFDWGEYAIWQWGPRLQVSIDGRRETVYSQRVIDEQRAIAQAQPEGKDFILRVRPEYVWLQPPARQMADWLMESGYRMDLETDHSFLLTRSDLAPLSAGRRASSCAP